MNRAQIDILLEKYWNAETSLADEQTLKEYFSYNEVPEDLKMYQDFFAEVQEQQIPVLSDDFDEKIMTQIEKEKVVKLNNSQLRTRFWQIAAIFLIVIGTSLFIISDIDTNSSALSKAEYAEAEKAYTETKLALGLVSRKLKKGQRPLIQLGKFNQNFQMKFK